jgi:hypothetical protein
MIQVRSNPHPGPPHKGEGEGSDMKKISDLHKTWMKDPDYLKEFDALEEEFSRYFAKVTCLPIKRPLQFTR